MTSRDPNRPRRTVEETGVRRKEQIIEDPSRSRAHTLNRVGQLVWLLFSILIGLIALRILLKLIAAQPTQPFASFVYGFTEPFVSLFYGLIANPVFNGTNLTRNVIEFTSLIAILVYALMAFVIVRFIKIAFAKSSPRRIRTYEEE
jgi:uncharacterized protein YggT (Ycf19 family)